MWKCPKECSTCNTSYCGTPDQEPDQCPCAKSEMPPRSEIKNVDGKPIPEHLYRKLVWTYTACCRRTKGHRLSSQLKCGEICASGHRSTANRLKKANGKTDYLLRFRRFGQALLAMISGKQL